MSTSVQGLLQILAQRKINQEQLEEDKRRSRWKEGQVVPDFLRKVLGTGLGGLMQLGTNRLGEAWLPSKQAALARSEAGTAKTALEIAKLKVAAEEEKRKQDVRSQMLGTFEPKMTTPAPDAIEAARQADITSAIGAETRASTAPSGLTREQFESFYKDRPEGYFTQQAIAGRTMMPRKTEADYREQLATPDRYGAEVIAQAVKRQTEEQTAAAHKAADTASKIAPMMRRSRIKARLPGDKGDFLSYFRGVQASNRNRGLTPLKFKSKELQLAYESVMPEAHDARKNGITFVNDDGNVVKLPPGKKAMFHVINAAGKKRMQLLRADYTDSPGKLERQRAAAKAKMARVERKIKSREKIANKRIKANEAKLKQEGLSEKDKLALKREIAADRTRLNEAKFALEVHKAEEGSERVITDEYGNTTVVRTKKTLSEEEGKELLKKSKAPAKAPTETKRAKPSVEEITRIADEIKASINFKDAGKKAQAKELRRRLGLL